MGLGFGLDRRTTIFKRKFRWLLRIPGISADGVNSLPPAKAARPSMSFKENEVQHLHETIYYPGKPEFKPFSLTLYDIKCNQNPVMEWLGRLFTAKTAEYKFVLNDGGANTSIKQNATLEMYDGCGNCIERWQYDNLWPQAVDFQELDMGSSDIVMADITCRYDRAYVIPCN
jgi:hypothetical protein